MINKIVVCCVTIAVMISAFVSCQNTSLINPIESLPKVTDEIDTVEDSIVESTVYDETTEEPIYAEYLIIPSTAEGVEIYCNELTARGADIPEKFYFFDDADLITVYCYDPVNEINDSNYQYLEIKNPGMPYVSMLHAVMYYRVPVSNITE